MVRFPPPKSHDTFCPPPFSPCRKRSPAKGVWQKSDEKSDKSVRKSDRKVTESVPKTKKVIELLLPHSFCGTLTFANSQQKYSRRVRKVFSGLRSESAKAVSCTVRNPVLVCFARCEMLDVGRPTCIHTLKTPLGFCPLGLSLWFGFGLGLKWAKTRLKNGHARVETHV